MGNAGAFSTLRLYLCVSLSPDVSFKAKFLRKSSVKILEIVIVREKFSPFPSGKWLYNRKEDYIVK